MYSLYINNTPDTNKIVNINGNSVTMYLSTPIILDKSKDWQLRVLQANIVFCEANITTLNNQFTYKYNNITYTKTIPTGLYGIDEINNTIARMTTGQNGDQLFDFVANPSTSTIIIYYLTPQTFIDCATPNNIMSILGFNASTGLIGGFAGNTGSIESADEQAHLNTLQQILVKCNITNGSYLNSRQTNIICGIPINVAPYSQLQKEFIHPVRNPIYVNRIDNIQITLLNQDGVDLDFTNGGKFPAESFNLVISIEPTNTPVM